MIIRNFTQADRSDILEMVAVFYTSPGVIQPIPVENFANVYDEMCDGGSHRLRGMLAEAEGAIAGFTQLSFIYSTEAGGAVVLIEEIYVKPEFQGSGAGTHLLNYIKQEYSTKAARLRLEVAPENTRAAALYQRLGFEVLPYHQMILEDF